MFQNMHFSVWHNLKQLAAGSGLSGDDVIDIIADVLGKKR